MAPKDICRQSKHRVLLDLLTLSINTVKPTEFVIRGTQRSQHCWCSIPLPSPPRGRLREQVSTLTTFRGPTMMMMTMMTIYRA